MGVWSTTEDLEGKKVAHQAAPTEKGKKSGQWVQWYDNGQKKWKSHLLLINKCSTEIPETTKNWNLTRSLGLLLQTIEDTDQTFQKAIEDAMRDDRFGIKHGKELRWFEDGKKQLEAEMGPRKQSRRLVQMV